MRAYRSSLKLFVFGIVGIVLIAAAADIMFGHWVSTPPDNNDGVLTTRGQAQQRGDLLWGGTMIATGVLLFGGSVTELVRRRPMVLVEGAGLVIDTGGDGDVIPWGDIDSVTSGVELDAYDGSRREQLIVRVKSGTELPDRLSGLQRNGDTVLIDAHDWASRVTEVALAAQGAHDHYERVENLRNFEPPSIVWETTIIQADSEAEEERE
jgi:hypothetical protein